MSRVERIPLSLTWTTKGNEAINKLLDKIGELGSQCEAELGNPLRKEDTTNNQEKDISSSVSNKNSYPIYPVTRTIVTCKYDEKEINFEYISTGTHVSTAISAISLNMGFHHSISTIKMDVKCLETDIKSLVKAVVIIGIKHPEKLVLGEWVSSDLLQALLQSMIIAGRKWLYREIDLDSNIIDKYKLIVKNTAELRASFYEHRLAFDGFDFNNSKFIMTNLKRLVVILKNK